MSAVAPRVAGAARRQLSPSPKPAAGGGTKEKDFSPASRDEKAETARTKRLPAPTVARTTNGFPSMLLRRQELLLRRVGAGAGGRSAGAVHPSPSSLSVSCASEASTADSFCSRASTGRIGRRPAAGTPGSGASARRRAAGSAGPPAARSVARNAVASVAAAAVAVGGSVNGDAASAAGPARCPWVTPNSDPCYAAFHDQEWGVPVHDDKKLFEMLVLSGALAEMAWPAILSKRDTFRQVFLDFDPLLVAKLDEKNFLGPASPASSLLSEHRVRVIIENARELLKVIDEFGSFDSYCWGFLSNKQPLVGKFRHTREVPLRTAKADALSQDLMRRGFRGVGPTVVYAFMQTVGMANDHLVTCYRFDECCAGSGAVSDVGRGSSMVSDQEVSLVCGLVQCAGLEPSRAATVIGIS